MTATPPANPPPAKKTVYWDYLRLGELLNLQGGSAGDEDKISDDELHFVVVHQVFELWFKLILRELRAVRDALAADRVSEETVPKAVHHLRRVNEILRVAVDHWRVVETLTPQDFLAFRGQLGDASGFQSFQIRELEMLLGLEAAQREAQGHSDPLPHILATAERSSFGPQIIERLERTGREPTLRQALHGWLSRAPVQGVSTDDPDAEAVRARFVTDYLAGWDRYAQDALAQLGSGHDTARAEARYDLLKAEVASFLHAEDVAQEERPFQQQVRAAIVFIESYRELPLLAWPRTLIDAVAETEEQLVLWRSRHARMVERVIGRRVGTGGAGADPGKGGSAVDYLDETTRYRVFPELWSVRTLLLPREYLPALEHEGFYRFTAE
jgi:tryptophan 2,3-dioxygenase